MCVHNSHTLNENICKRRKNGYYNNIETGAAASNSRSAALRAYGLRASVTMTGPRSVEMILSLCDTKVKLDIK